LSNSDEERWQQRHDSLRLALVPLNEACELETLNDLERTGLIKNFEICFELSWKVLKDLLFYEGYDEKTPRSIFRKSFEVSYINEGDCEQMLDALSKRNLLSHTYDREFAVMAVEQIKQSYRPVLLKIYDNLKARRNN